MGSRTLLTASIAGWGGGGGSHHLPLPLAPIPVYVCNLCGMNFTLQHKKLFVRKERKNWNRTCNSYSIQYLARVRSAAVRCIAELCALYGPVQCWWWWWSSRTRRKRHGGDANALFFCCCCCGCFQTWFNALILLLIVPLARSGCTLYFCRQAGRERDQTDSQAGKQYWQLMVQQLLMVMIAIVSGNKE